MKSIASVKVLKACWIFFFSVYTAKRNINFQGNSWIVISKEEERKGRELSFRWNELSGYLICHIAGNEMYENKKASCL